MTGASVQASASIRDGSGGSTPASNVTWSSSNSAVASVSSTGLITGVNKGTANILGTSGGVTGQVTMLVTPAPVAVTIAAGDGQSGPKGSQLADPLCVYVLDADGNNIIGITVNYAVASGGGQIPPTAVTDGNGIAISGRFTLGPTAGTQTVVASVPGATSVTFTATAQ